LRQRNDETVYLTITSGGQPYNLTGCEVDMVIKSSTTVADSTGTTLSTTTGEIALTNAVGGQATVTVSSAVTATACTNWVMRVDVISGGKRKTAGYGSYTVIAL